MRFLPCFLLIGSLCLTQQADAETAKRTCLDSSRVRNWIVIDDETLLLDAGSRKYRVNLQQTCVRLSTSPILQFKGDPITGRICSGTLDAVRVDGDQCRISRIEEIDKQTFKDSQNKKKLSLKVSKSARIEK
jgi:hypothetical protein